MPVVYIVKAGDTLWGIGRQFNIAWQAIWNDVANKSIVSQRRMPEHIRLGDRLVIPDRTPSVLTAQDRVTLRCWIKEQQPPVLFLDLTAMPTFRRIAFSG